MSTLNINGKTVTVKREADTPLSGAARRAEDGPPSSLRQGTVRRLHGPSRRRGGAFVHDTADAVAGRRITTTRACRAKRRRR